MIRENRYMVFKRADIEPLMGSHALKELNRLEAVMRLRRDQNNKQPFQCVVVERDWPEYEPTWQAIGRRVDTDDAFTWIGNFFTEGSAICEGCNY